MLWVEGGGGGGGGGRGEGLESIKGKIKSQNLRWERESLREEVGESLGWGDGAI